MPDTPEALARFHIVIVLPVQWGDQDALGHVNNAVYFRWFESARIAYFAGVGLDTGAAVTGFGPILAHISCDFCRKVTYPDTVHIGCRVAGIGRSSIQMEYAAYSESQDLIAAEAKSTIVYFDFSANRPQLVPDNMRAAIEEMEGERFA